MPISGQPALAKLLLQHHLGNAIYCLTTVLLYTSVSPQKLAMGMSNQMSIHLRPCSASCSLDDLPVKLSTAANSPTNNVLGGGGG